MIDRLNSHFKFTVLQRNGIFVLLLSIVFIQVLYFFIHFDKKELMSFDEEEWYSYQSKIDSLKEIRNNIIQPFNPNFITDYKGYKLGMTLEEIDRLLIFRKSGAYINSSKEFQEITKISDSMLTLLVPYFKFLEWVNKSQEKAKIYQKKINEKSVVVLDINEATVEDLMQTKGIGITRAERIIKERTKLGAFVSIDQIDDIWGLPSDVVQRIKEHFQVIKKPNIVKININQASVKELMTLSFIKYNLAREIIAYRNMNNGIKGVEDLKNIPNFPFINSSIVVYLEF